MARKKLKSRPDPLQRTDTHQHEWVVFSTALKQHWLMLQCVGCGLHGTVDDPTKKEWDAAFEAPSKPYQWVDESRVTIQGHVSRRPSHVMRVGDAPQCQCYAEFGIPVPTPYERLHPQILGPARPLSPQEKQAILDLAKFAGDNNLCSVVLPSAFKDHRKATGQKQPAITRQTIRQFVAASGQGLHCSAQGVARLLRDYAEFEEQEDELNEENGEESREHRAVTVRVGQRQAEIDEQIAPLIRELWIAGIETVMSCQQDGFGYVWVEFDSPDHLQTFLDAVAEYEEGADTLYNRITGRWQIDEDTSAPRWKYGIHPQDLGLRECETEDGYLDEEHDGVPSFWLYASVRFPPCDLPVVLERMRKYNHALKT